MKLLEEKVILMWGLITEESIIKIKKENKTVILPEHRPYLLGLKYNLSRLKQHGILCVYCNDNSLGFLFYKGMIEKTYLLYIDKQAEGLQCFSGSLYVVLMSKLHNIPLEAIKGGRIENTFLDKDAATLEGRSLLIEEQPVRYVVQPDNEFISWEELK